MKPLSLEAIEARDAIARGKTLLRNVRHGGFDVELLHHKADLWVVLRRDAQGGVALRTPLLAEGAKCTAQTNADGWVWRPGA